MAGFMPQVKMMRLPLVSPNFHFSASSSAAIAAG